MSKLYHTFGAAGRLWPVLWNAPNTLLGLLASLGGQCFWDKTDGVLEVTGGWFIRLLARRGWAVAITLGDVVLSRDERIRDEWRAHERVHVCQGRRWGPLFLPAYVLESLYQWLRVRDAYRANRFEREAFGD